MACVHWCGSDNGFWDFRVFRVHTVKLRQQRHTRIGKRFHANYSKLLLMRVFDISVSFLDIIHAKLLSTLSLLKYLYDLTY